MRGRERPHRSRRRSPCKELVWDNRTAGSDDGGTQGDVYLPICARARGCISGFLDWFQTKTVVFMGSVYLPVSLSASILPPTFTNLILSTSGSLVKVCQSNNVPIQLPSFCFGRGSIANWCQEGNISAFTSSVAQAVSEKVWKDIILDCWF